MVPVRVVALVEKVSTSNSQVESWVDTDASVDFEVSYRKVQAKLKRSEYGAIQARFQTMFFRRTYLFHSRRS
jgi:hypothetical protein